MDQKTRWYTDIKNEMIFFYEGLVFSEWLWMYTPPDQFMKKIQDISIKKMISFENQSLSANLEFSYRS